MDCIFCKLASGEIPTDVVYEDEKVFAFHDQNPQADTHVLLIPKKHVSGLADDDLYSAEFAETREALWQAIPKVLKALDVDEQDGFRVIANCGKGAGQSVFHLHFHLLSGSGLSERLV